MTRRLQELGARQAQLIEEIEAEGGNCLKEAELMEISELFVLTFKREYGIMEKQEKGT